MERSRASKSHFWAALFKPHISILDISLWGGGGVHISLGITLRPFYQEDARITLITSLPLQRKIILHFKQFLYNFFFVFFSFRYAIDILVLGDDI